jgi:hypothetical protein
MSKIFLIIFAIFLTLNPILCGVCDNIYDLSNTNCYNDVIKFDHDKFRAGHACTNNNGDMIVEFSLNPGESKKRLFYGLKKNGRYYFPGEPVYKQIDDIVCQNCDDDKFSADYHYKLDDVEKELADIADDVRERKFMQGRKKYYINGGEIEVVKPVDNATFCANCSRLRITPDGKIKPCLLRNDNLVELISHIRNNESEEKLEEIFLSGIYKREPFNKD